METRFRPFLSQRFVSGLLPVLLAIGYMLYMFPAERGLPVFVALVVACISAYLLSYSVALTEDGRIIERQLFHRTREIRFADITEMTFYTLKGKAQYERGPRLVNAKYECFPRYSCKRLFAKALSSRSPGTKIDPSYAATLESSQQPDYAEDLKRVGIFIGVALLLLGLLWFQSARIAKQHPECAHVGWLERTYCAERSDAADLSRLVDETHLGPCESMAAGQARDECYYRALPLTIRFQDRCDLIGNLSLRDSCYLDNARFRSVEDSALCMRINDNETRTRCFWEAELVANMTASARSGN